MESRTNLRGNELSLFVAKLSPETSQTIWGLQYQLLELINTARTLEMSLFGAVGFRFDLPNLKLSVRFEIELCGVGYSQLRYR